MLAAFQKYCVVQRKHACWLVLACSISFSTSALESQILKRQLRESLCLFPAFPTHLHQMPKDKFPELSDSSPQKSSFLKDLETG